jgi:hypothetical protein
MELLALSKIISGSRTRYLRAARASDFSRAMSLDRAHEKDLARKLQAHRLT